MTKIKMPTKKTLDYIHISNWYWRRRLEASMSTSL